MTAVTICSDFGAHENKVCHCFHYFPIYLPWTDGTDAMIFIFWVLSFKSVFHSPLSLSSRGSLVLHFLPEGWCHMHASLRLLIFLLAILIPACASSSLALHMMYSAYKLNKQGDNIQPWCIPSPIWNQSIFLYLVLTVASWSVFRFLRKRWSGLVFPSLEEFSTVCCDAHSQRLCVANKAEVDVFSGTLLLFWSSNGCWQFDLRFLCLF